MSDARIPLPRTLGPVPSLGWGVLGPGGISERFAEALRHRGTQRLAAVGSRSEDRAAAFAARHGVPRAVGSPADLVQLPEVDIVYIATPHNSHRILARLAIEAGKHVVIEKPFTTTADDARAVIEQARAVGVLAMEAMWTRYLPQADVLRQLLDDGAIGDVTHVAADFGFVAEYDPAGRLWAPELAGGALLDAGVYPVSFIASVLGMPESVHAVGTLAPTGVDDHAQLTLGYASGALGAATTSLRSALPTRAVISGTRGRIEIEPAYIRPSTLVLSTQSTWGPDGSSARWTDDTLVEPYDALAYEADAAASYASDGLVESPIHPHDEIIGVIGILEEARRQLGAP